MINHIKQFYIDMLAHKRKIKLVGKYARWEVLDTGWTETEEINSFPYQDMWNSWYTLWIAGIANKEKTG